MSDINAQTIESIVKLGRTSAEPKILTNGNIPLAVIAEGTKIESLEKFVFNEHQAAPERIRGNVAVLDPASFIEYYALFSDPNSRIFAHEPSISVVGVIDYHGAAEGGPRWCQHRVTLTLRQSEEWKVWAGKNNQQFSQEEFAEFLEQNSMDIIKPSPADMTETARDLQATTEVEFGGGYVSQNGQKRIKYTETTKATVGGGSLAVPEQFTISLPVFVGGTRVSMQALLRFRVKEGKLVFWYTLVRPAEVMRQAFLGARDLIADGLKAVIINGVPA